MAFAWQRQSAGPFRLLSLAAPAARPGGVDSLVNVAHQVLYAAFRYGWSETTVGLTLAFVGLCAALVWLGRRAVTPGSAHGAQAIAGMCAAVRYDDLLGPAAVVPAGVPVGVGGLVGPTVMDRMSRRVSPSEQGQPPTAPRAASPGWSVPAFSPRPSPI
jgi:DHA1 family tetracycline resistance protein-like MFS transporter